MDVSVLNEAYFISDLHLKSRDEEKCFVFLEFLRKLPDLDSQSRTGLFLVGDLFDLWIGSHIYFIQYWQTLIEELKKVQGRGYQIFYFEGNHDLYLERYWRDKLGLEVHCAPAYFEVAGQVVRVEHGDLMDLEDRGYRFLKGLLHQPAVRWVIEHLPGIMVAMIGGRVSRLSREYTTQAKTLSDERFRTIFNEHVKRAYQEENFDLIVTGHCHIEADFCIAVHDREVRSLNLGWWNAAYKVVHLHSSTIDWINWKPERSS